MTSQQLPERASLEQLRKQARSLLRAARENNPEALERFRVLPSLSKKSTAELSAMKLALHDAQSVIAREHGFKSWNRLREHVEERTMSFDAAVNKFVRCATGGAAARAMRLLELHPAIAHASLYTELVLGDSEAVRARLRKNPDVVWQAGGPQNWEPLLYVCQTCLHRNAPEFAGQLVAIARELLLLGANPNAEYHFNWHRELPRTALWGALCVVWHLPLAEALLEGGANPTDGVSMHIAAGHGDLAALDLLLRFNVNVNGIPGGVPPLRYMMGWADLSAREQGVRWLLEHGADPNLAWGDLGDAPLHIAAQRWDVPTVEMLVQHGADIHRRRADGRTAHTLAELYGNADIAEWLRAHGARDELSPLQRFVALCARGDRVGAETILATNPHLRGELQTEHHLIVQIAAERGDVAALQAMLTCGFDPNVRDSEGITALHRAAMAGRAESVRVLIEHGADVHTLDSTFAGTPLVWAAEGWSMDSGRSSDYANVARYLIAAGSSLEWVPPENTPHPEKGLEQLIELCRAAGAVVS
ncbi:MAG TPA: ankyrin repeat domain-containing protein [Steroidobacteraceae bacterium]